MLIISIYYGDQICGNADVESVRLRQEDDAKQIPWKVWIPECFDESKILEAIRTIRQNKQKLLKEKKLAELTKKFQFERYAMARLTENDIFEHTRMYLACFM